ncbi:MAG: hypothetical protein KAW12_30825 [Candidatus Aminicenantes bacterium]|nr:hypothetical protein [Candidatus Aminicenantes bacterium]
MQQVSIKSQVIKEMDVLPLNLQRSVLAFVKILAKPTIPKGVPGRNLMKFAGILTEDEADELSRIIEEDCERIDDNEW